MGSLRYFTATLSLLSGIAGFYYGLPALGFSSFLIVLIFDSLLPADTRQYNNNALLARLVMYIHYPLMVWLYLAMYHYMADHLAAGTLLWYNVAGGVLATAWLTVIPHLSVIHDMYHGHNRFERFLGFLGAFLWHLPERWETHVRGHHRHTGTLADHDSPRRGEPIYTFVFRAHFGSWKDLREMDRALEGKPLLERLRKARFYRAILLQAAFDVTVLYLAGPVVGAILISVFLLCALLVECLNYIQHFGLVRVPGQPHESRHTWNHLTPLARAFALEASNHSPHHNHGDRPFYENAPIPDAPQMGNPLLHLVVCFVPPLFQRWMAMPKLKHWDLHFANPAERELAREANRRAGWPDWLNEEKVTLPRAA